MISIAHVNIQQKLKVMEHKLRDETTKIIKHNIENVNIEDIKIMYIR
jgi:hypothetical protein